MFRLSNVSVLPYTVCKSVIYQKKGLKPWNLLGPIGPVGPVGPVSPVAPVKLCDLLNCCHKPEEDTRSCCPPGSWMQGEIQTFETGSQ